MTKNAIRHGFFHAIFWTYIYFEKKKHSMRFPKKGLILPIRVPLQRKPFVFSKKNQEMFRTLEVTNIHNWAKKHWSIEIQPAGLNPQTTQGESLGNFQWIFVGVTDGTNLLIEISHQSQDNGKMASVLPLSSEKSERSTNLEWQRSKNVVETVSRLLADYETHIVMNCLLKLATTL